MIPRIDLSPQGDLLCQVAERHTGDRGNGGEREGEKRGERASRRPSLGRSRKASRGLMAILMSHRR
jgi:hypothetical protein